MPAALRTMGDLFARHRERIAAAAPPPAPAPTPRAPRLGISGRVERIARGEGWELRVNGQRVATVTPGPAGFVVANVEAGHRSPPLEARQAEALAARIARLAALPSGKGEA
jgi:hypothetical protein